MDQKLFDSFKLTFAASDKAVQNFVKGYLSQHAMRSGESNARAVTLTLASNLMTEAAVLMHLMEMPERARYDLTEVCLHTGEIMVLLRNNRITVAESMQLMQDQMEQAKRHLDARFGPEVETANDA